MLSFRSGPARTARVVAALGPGGGPIPARDVSRLPITSPFSPDSHLIQWVADDVLGEAAASLINSRASAMRLSGIARGRNMLVTQIARNPLVVLRGDAQVVPSPSWCLGTRDGSSPQLRTAWTVDDLIFYGWSLWRRANGADGFPIAADHVNYDDWNIDDDNRLCVNGFPVDNEDEWTLIPGIHEGILSFGADVLSDARDLRKIVKNRLTNPNPDVNLEAQPDSEDMTAEEWREFVNAYVANRKINGNVGFTNRYVKAVFGQGQKDADLMIDAKNASTVEQARIIGVHAGLLDATAPKASLNYETATGRNQEFVDLDLWTYMLPITARTSMDDFVPHGSRTAFDLSGLTGPWSSTGPVTED